MEEIFEIKSAYLMTVPVSEDDIGIISNSLLKTFNKIKDDKDITISNLYDYLLSRWDQLSSVLEKLPYEDKFMSPIVKLEEFSIPNDNERNFFMEWAGSLSEEIRFGGLYHFKGFFDISFEYQSIKMLIQKLKYLIHMDKLIAFKERTSEIIGNLNNKIHSSLKDFIDWTFDKSKRRPWLSPFFMGAITLLVIFGVAWIGAFSATLGTLTILWQAVKLLCIICTIYHGIDNALSLSDSFLEEIGLTIIP